jgi:PAT family beta-lactamase induction signal transducer AmpG
MDASSEPRRTPWRWVPSLYFAEGLPLILISAVSVIFYKKMGIGNTDIALFTAWLYLPWVIKGLWGPLVDQYRTKRCWIVLAQFIMGAGLACVALLVPLPRFFQLTFALFWLLALDSATHDIAADGFYILALDKHRQVWFSWVRNTSYRAAIIAGQGLLVMLVGHIEAKTGLPPVALPVAAIRQAGITDFAFPRTMAFPPVANKEPRILIIPDQLEIAVCTRSRQAVKGLVELAEQWNAGKLPQLPDGVLLGRPDGDPADAVGNVAPVMIQLTAPPPQDRPVVVAFGRESGDKSISLLTEGRLVFTAADWARPRLAILQADHRLRQATQTGFIARAGNIRLSWVIAFLVVGALYLCLAGYHLLALPRPAADRPAGEADGNQGAGHGFAMAFRTFFANRNIIGCLAFLLLYRLGESQLVKLAAPFLLDAQEKGGLALSTGQVGFVYGTVGMLALTLGGILGALLAARNGLKAWLWPMALAINVPNLVYVYLAWALPDNFLIVNACIAVEQFGYGLGFTAYMLYMIYFVQDSEYKTAHYAILTGFMALGMMLPGMASGWIQEQLGYFNFFVWICLSTIPGFVAVALIKVDPEFGRKAPPPATQE